LISTKWLILFLAVFLIGITPLGCATGEETTEEAEAEAAFVGREEEPEEEVEEEEEKEAKEEKEKGSNGNGTVGDPSFKHEVEMNIDGEVIEGEGEEWWKQEEKENNDQWWD